MKLTMPKNWVAKLLSLILAIAIWFLIKSYLKGDPGSYSVDPMNPPTKASIGPEPAR